MKNKHLINGINISKALAEQSLANHITIKNNVMAVAEKPIEVLAFAPSLLGSSFVYNAENPGY